MPKSFDVILFDMDNVLIDTRQSYLAAIQKTVEIYLNRPGIVSAREVDQFKLLGGFNDDWDCSWGLIAFLETAIQGKPIHFGDHRRQRLSLSELNQLFPERPLGIEGLLRHLRVLYERVEEPPFKKVARIFQEVYLGMRLFGKKTLYWTKPGLIEKEKLIFPKSLLKRIKNKGVQFGIVTGRNQFEAHYALKRFGIEKLFDVLITIDEVKRAEKKGGKLLRKPNPWPILEATRRYRFSQGQVLGKPVPRRTGTRFLYLGDLPDDILAAKKAGQKIRIHSAAFPGFTRDPETTRRELKKLKPDFYLKTPQDLVKIL